MVIAPNPVTIDVAVNITTMEETLRNDSDSPLCRLHRWLKKATGATYWTGLAAAVHMHLANLMTVVVSLFAKLKPRTTCPFVRFS